MRCLRRGYKRRGKGFVPIGKTEGPSWEGCAAGSGDKGRKWECADVRGECVEKVDGVL